MHWDMIGAIAGLLGLVTGYLTWYVRSIIRDENAKQLVQINGTYLRSASSSLTGAEIGRRLDAIDHSLKELTQYTHERIHQHANVLQGLEQQQQHGHKG